LRGVTEDLGRGELSWTDQLADVAAADMAKPFLSPTGEP